MKSTSSINLGSNDGFGPSLNRFAVLADRSDSPPRPGAERGSVARPAPDAARAGIGRVQRSSLTPASRTIDDDVRRARAAASAVGAMLPRPVKQTREAASFDQTLKALTVGRHDNPHAVLGPQEVDGGRRQVVRVLAPDAEQVHLAQPQKLWRPGAMRPMRRLGSTSVFELELKPGEKLESYSFKVLNTDGVRYDLEDPYRFSNTVDPLDCQMYNDGVSKRADKFLGAHEMTVDGVRGYRFTVFAPNATRVSLVGEFNRWNGLTNPMRRLGDSGVFEIFIPGMKEGTKYKFEVFARNYDDDGVVRERATQHADPFARSSELRGGGNASVTVAPSRYEWNDRAWMEKRARGDFKREPVSAYQLHPGYWREKPGGGFLNWREMVEPLLRDLKESRFTHVQLMGLLEHPLDESWGYHVTGYTAPTSRHGTPDDFRYFVDKLHEAGIGVYFDWVPAHFCTDAHGLALFDGTHLYDHADPRQGYHNDWDSRIFNFGSPHVKSFLTTTLISMLQEYHLDGARVDGVASTLYLDYSRSDERDEDGNPRHWVPNRFGVAGEWKDGVHVWRGNDNLDAVALYKELNPKVHASVSGAVLIAEESTGWPGVTHEPDFDPAHETREGQPHKALGFDLKWNMGWMNDTMQFFEKRFAWRGWDLGDMLKPFSWKSSENYVYALAHDEVGKGKPSLLGWMLATDDWPEKEEWQFACLRLLYGCQWAMPGHKLLFMGGEFAQKSGFDDRKHSLDWADREQPKNQGVLKLISDLNELYRNEPAMYERQFSPDGCELTFRDQNPNEQGEPKAIFGMLRVGDGYRGEDGKVKDPSRAILFVQNLKADGEQFYRVGVDAPGFYKELINTDSECYGGKNAGNCGGVEAEALPWQGKPYSICVTLPAASMVAFKNVGSNA